MHNIFRFIPVLLLAAALPAAAEPRRNIDVVIALDVSGSMSDLIDSAKSRLWDVVNTFSRAQPQPELRVGIVSFGNPGYGAHTGYVRVDLPLTGDLDRVNETLFAFGTNGGDEYVARAVATSLDSLQWSRSPDAMRVMFVAGNESADQDPNLDLDAVLARAAARGITVNPIYCGSEQDSIAPGWRRIAFATQGAFAAIDPAANVVAQVETPMDQRLADLSAELNATYIPYGSEGDELKERQARQDDNAGGISLGALASRVVTKASALYRNVEWDLVDWIEAGNRVSDLEPEKLPEPMRALAPAEVEQVVRAEAERRAAIKKEIADLDAGRRAYIEAHRENEGAAGLDAALVDALTEQAEAKGFAVE